MLGRYGWAGIAAISGIVGGPWIGPARADDIQVNTYTTSYQVAPWVASAADGRFVVVWAGLGAGPDPDSSIQGQRYASDGSPLGGEFQINSYTTDGQYRTAVAADADGDFVVVWNSNGSAGTDTIQDSVQGQRFASDGSPVGDEFQVNTYTPGYQYRAAVASDADGDFVVAWGSYIYKYGGSTANIYGRRFASDGSPVAGEFQVNAYTTNIQSRPSVVMGADGDAIVVWDGASSMDPSGGIQGRRFASDGSPVGGEFQVNTYTGGGQRYASVAMAADGRFIVVWRNPEIRGRRFASDGSPVGGEFQVNTYTFGTQRSPEVAMDPDGDFVVVWDSDGPDSSDPSGFSVRGQRYTSDGSPVGGEFQVNTYTSGDQTNAALTLDSGGNLIVAWSSEGSSGTDTDNRSIQRSRVAPIFADSFESGDMGSWSATTTP